MFLLSELQNNLSEEIKTIVFKFDILHRGWEMDQTGWVVELRDGSKRLVLTNHGKPYFADIEELYEYIENYKDIIANMENAMLEVQL